MRKLVYLTCLAALYSVPSQAGENAYLGVITVSGASLTNLTTAAPFAIPPGAKITVNCSAAVNMLVDNRSTAASGATKGLTVPATTNFPTSVGREQGTIVVNGAVTKTAVIAVFGTGACDVWVRDGNE